MKWRHWIGLVVSVFCLWWALKGVSWREVWSALREARLALLLAAAVGSVLVGVFLRALRWRVFLPPSRTLASVELVTGTGVGLMANNVLPARMGEFVRAYVLGRRTGVPVTTVIGSLFVERLFDGAALALILVAGVFLTEMPDWMVGLARLAAGLFAGLLAGEVLLICFPRQFFKLLHRTTARFLPRRWEAELEGALHRFIEGFQLLRDPRRVLAALLLTFVFWGANGFLFYLGLLAFDLGRVGFGGSMIVQSVTALGISVPASPGFVGTFQFFVVQALSAFDVSKDLAFGYALAFHATQYLPVTLFGFLLLWRANLSWGEIEKSEERIEEELIREEEELEREELLGGAEGDMAAHPVSGPAREAQDGRP